MKIQFIDYGLDENLLPRKKYVHDAGMDVYLNNDTLIKAHETVDIPLGFGLGVPTGFMVQLIERSSIAKLGITTHISPVDPDYSGEIHLIVTNLTNEDKSFTKGERIAQLVMVPIAYFEITKENIERRNTNGLGSSGK